MKKNLLFRLLTFILISALFAASVPLHQIFHDHHYKNADISKNADSKITDKACCKPFEALSGNVVSLLKVYFNNPVGNTIYIKKYSFYFIESVFQLSNKAPPLSLS